MSHISSVILGAKADSYGNLFDLTFEFDHVPLVQLLENVLAQYPSLRGKISSDEFRYFLSIRTSSVKITTPSSQVEELKYMNWSIPKFSSSYDSESIRLSVTFRVDAEWSIYHFFVNWRQAFSFPEYAPNSPFSLIPPEMNPDYLAKSLTISLFAQSSDVQGNSLSLLTSKNPNTISWVFYNVFPNKVEVNHDFSREGRNPIEMNVDFYYSRFSIVSKEKEIAYQEKRS